MCEQLKQTSQTQFNISESVASFYGESSRVPLIDNFRTAQRMIFTQHWSSFVSDCAFNSVFFLRDRINFLFLNKRMPM